MKIAIIGAGAMGSIYGAHLSLQNEVYLIDTNQEVVNQINENGLKLQENGQDVVYHPTAATNAEGLDTMDLIILFVKALFSEAALAANVGMVGEDTYIMTLQNGSGHEEVISKFVSEDHVIIGTTEDNGAVLAPGYVRRGGVGKTNIGMLLENEIEFLNQLRENFDLCGFQAHIHENIMELIWDKLMTNVSLSIMTGVLQVKMGYIAENAYAWDLTQRLIKETITVASALGMSFDEEKMIQRVKETSINNPEGITSICADLRDGRKTEVDTISGSVVRAAKKCGIEVPTHQRMVELVHAMETRSSHSVLIK